MLPEIATEYDLNAVVNATVPPVLAVPLTTLKATLLDDVSFTQPVGAAVCWNNILEPAGITTDAAGIVCHVGFDDPLDPKYCPAAPTLPSKARLPLIAVGPLEVNAPDLIVADAASKLVNPVMFPPVIDTLSLSCSARVPSLIASTTFDPSLYTKFVFPAPTVIPVPVEFLTTIASVQVLLIRYSFCIVGTIRFLVAPPVVPTKFNLKFLAS